jgi:hypothetical protein
MPFLIYNPNVPSLNIPNEAGSPPPTAVTDPDAAERAGLCWILTFVDFLRTRYRNETGQKPAFYGSTNSDELDSAMFASFIHEPTRLKLIAFTRFAYQHWSNTAIRLPDLAEQHSYCRETFCHDCDEGWSYEDEHDFESWETADNNGDNVTRAFICTHDCDEFGRALTTRMSDLTNIDGGLLDRLWDEFNKLWRDDKWASSWLESPLNQFLLRRDWPT